MRIISPFHDYYDSVMRMDEDRELIFLRREKHVEARIFPICTGSSYWSDSNYLIVEDCVIGFCGKLYPLLILNRPQIKTDYCFSIEEADKFIEDNFKEQQINAYFKKHPNWTPRRVHPWGWHHTHPIFKMFFDKVLEAKDKYSKFFIENNTPIFVAKHGGYNGVVINDCLKSYQFYRIFEPYTAYQEISMYLGGLATPQKKMPDISDEDMRDIKGFDKWSFRKPPSK